MGLALVLAGPAVAGGSGAATAPARRVMPALLSRAGTSNVVYILGTTGCATARCVRLYRSDIDATGFTRVNPPPVKGERGALANSTLEKLVFANVNDGFALVGYDNFGVTLYATSNGARSWRKVERVDEGEMEIFVSSSQIFIARVHCKPRTMKCSQWVTQRSSLSARHWATVPQLWKTGTGPKDVYYGPSVAAYRKDVWELETGPDYLWTSHDDGRTFARSRLKFPQLVSVSGCSLFPMSSLALWAECPTGMQVSFWYASDGGASWSQVTQRQFFGTGGGAFDPITRTVAYLDYGGVVEGDNFVRLSDGGRRAQSVGELRCTDVWPMFTTVARGLAVCDENYTQNSLRRTSNGGATWSNVNLPRTYATSQYFLRVPYLFSRGAKVSRRSVVVLSLLLLRCS
jgi:hypothetical protein